MKEALRRSPLHNTLQDVGTGLEVRSGWLVATGLVSATDAAVPMLTIADESAHGKLLLEGENASDVIATAMHLHPPSVGLSVPYRTGRVYSLRPDLFFMSTLPTIDSEWVKQLRATAARNEGLVTMTDMTDGRSQIRVTGKVCRQFLAKLCARDFGDFSFPDGSARTTSLARTTQLILRSDQHDQLSFVVVGGRSLGAYVWDTMVQAGHEWTITPTMCESD